MNLKQKSFKAISWDIVGKLVQQGSAFLVSIVLCRLLEPQDFGVVAMAGVFIAISNIFLDFNLSSALIQKKSPTQIQYSTIFYMNLIAAVCLSITLYTCAPLIGLFYKNETVTLVVRVLSFRYFFNALVSVQSTIFRKKIDFKSLTLCKLVGFLFAAPCGIAAAYAGLGVWALVIQGYIGTFVTTIAIWHRSNWRPSLLFSLREIRDLWSFGYKLFLSGMIDAVYSRLDILVIGKMFPPAILGYYNRAKNSEQFIIKYTSSSLALVLFPVFSQIKDDLKKVIDITNKSLNLVAFLSCALMGLLFLIAEDFITLLYSEKWAPAVPYLKVLLLTGYAYPVSSIIMNVIRGRGKSGDFLRAEIYKKILLTLGFVVGFSFGLTGYLWALVIVSFISVFFINGYYLEKEIGYKRLHLFICVAKYFILTSISVILCSYLYAHIPHVRFLRITLTTLAYTVLYGFLNNLLCTEGWAIFGHEVTLLSEKIPPDILWTRPIKKAIGFLFK